MELHLRFGMHRDIQLMHEERSSYDGFVIPAHILAYQEASTAAFVTSLPDKTYVIDPMTFILQNPSGTHFTEEGELRPSVRKLCDEYAKDLVPALQKLKGSATLSVSDLRDIPSLAQGVVEFQLNKVSTAAKGNAAAKYLKRYARSEYKHPRYVLAPYFFFESIEDAWYKLSLSVAKRALAIKTPVPVAAVLAAHLSALTDAGIERIVKDYRDFECVFVWIHDFSQTQVSAHAIVRLRKLISALADVEVRAELLYGGYVGVLANWDGLKAISHGILYTTHKSMFLTPGGGGVPERYYIPAFHEFRSLSQTEAIVQKRPELLCKCAICKKIVRGDPDRFMQLATQPELLRRHFLTVRRLELESVRSGKLEGLLTSLEETWEEYGEFLSLLPNPDAFASESPMQGIDYLATWVEAFRATV